MRSRSRRDERGAATVFGIALVGMLLVFAVACCAIGAVVAAHRRAEAAADLAALAGAQALQSGRDPCGAAATVAVRNGASVDSCAVAGFEVTVGVRVQAAPGFGSGLALRARARAGPQSSLSAAGSVAEEHLEQRDRAGLVERVVLVAALG